MMSILFLVLALQLLGLYFLLRISNFSWEDQNFGQSPKRHQDWKEAPIDEFGLFFSCNEQLTAQLKSKRKSQVKSKIDQGYQQLHNWSKPMLVYQLQSLLKPLFCAILFALFCLFAVHISKTHGKGEIKSIAQKIVHKAQSY